MRIIDNLKPFNQGEVNFVETVFYDELVLDDECPTPGTPGALVLEEEEGVNTHDLRDLLDRKRQKKEASSLRSQVCLVGQVCLVCLVRPVCLVGWYIAFEGKWDPNALRKRVLDH